MKNKKIFFTLPHNNPSGGVKVVNEFVNLCREKGYESFLCLPSDEVKLATFLNNSAPVKSLYEMIKLSTSEDYIICCWQSKDEVHAVKKSKAKLKVLWQHGILIPNTNKDVGDLIYKEKIFNKYANVSHSCGIYIKNKYNLDKMHTINPFFEINRKEIIKENERNGFLILARRGSEYIPKIKNELKNLNQSLTILYEPYKNNHFINLLKIHKYFISIDNGLNYSLSWKEKLKGKKLNWIKHDKNYLGFPVPPLEAALTKTIVIGFAMGGGLEWMNSECLFLAKDNDINDLIQQIHKAIMTDNLTISSMQEEACRKAEFFNKENSWKQLINILEIKDNDK